MDADKRVTVFVSHHSSTAAIAGDVERALAARGVDCWMAPRDVEPGEPFDLAVHRAIGRSRALLLLFSAEADRSRHVKRELILADDAGKPIIPLRLEHTRPDQLAYHLADTQWIDWIDRGEAALDRVARKARSPERARLGEAERAASEASRAAGLAFGEFRMDLADERLHGPAGPIKLGNKAWRVLLRLAESEGRLLTKDTLFASVWDGTIVSESALTSVIKELRRALGDTRGEPRFIESVYGRGYRFIAPVSAAPAEPIESRAPARPAEARGKPPVVFVPAFRGEAIAESHPHCAAALREEVLSGLARFREIQLVADNRHDDDAAARERRSDRDYQLTATLLPHGKGVKVIARAKRLADGRIVWADTMALADTGAARGVETIVRRIIGAALPAVDEDIIESLPVEPDDFYDRYLIAKRRSLTAKDHAEARAAAGALEALIAERPDFGLTYPPLVRLYNTDFFFTGLGSTGPAERARALALAKAGLAADRRNVHAHTVLGFCHLWHDERDLARPCFDQALAMNPYNPARINEVASGMIYLGELGEARALLAMSAQLQAWPDDSYYEDHCLLSLLDDAPEEALGFARRMSEPRFWSSFYVALAEGLADPSGPRAALRAWVAMVEARWLGDRPPSRDELEGWLAFHTPLALDLKQRFLGLARREFEAIRQSGGPPEARSRSRSRAR